MRPGAFLNEGKFYKGNLHTHSTNSDGVLSPEIVCKKYKQEGYDFLCISDHFVGAFNYPVTDTTQFRDDQFTTLLGAEVHSGSMLNGQLWHILAVGLSMDFTPSNSPNFIEISKISFFLQTFTITTVSTSVSATNFGRSL